MESLVVSICPRALFISSCSQSTLSERVLGSVPGLVPGWQLAGLLVSLEASDAWVREGEWLMGMASLDLTAHGDACWESYWQVHSQNWPVQPKQVLPFNGCGVTRAAESGLLRVLFTEAELEVSSTICDKSSWSAVAMLVQLASVLEHSTAQCGEGSGVEVLRGPGMWGILSLGIAHGRSTQSSEHSWTGPPRVSISHTGGWGTEHCTGSSSPFKPSGQLCSSHIAGPFAPAIGRDIHWCSCLVLHQSWCWYDPCWMGVHVGHTHWAQRHMSNYHLCQWVRWVSLPPHPWREDMLGVGAPTLWSGWMPSHPQWSSPVPSRDMPYCVGASLCLPTPLHGRGLRALTKSHLSPGNVIGKHR